MEVGKQEAVVLYPSPAIGHLISMVELGKRIVSHYPSLAIHILIIPQPYEAGETKPYISHVSATVPSITFHRLPAPLSAVLSSDHHETLMFETLMHYNDKLVAALTSISSGSIRVRSLIIDFFCTPALEVAAKMKLPCYYFLTAGACGVAVFLYLPTIHKLTDKSFKDMESDIDVPGLSPIPAADMPTPLLDRNDVGYDYFLRFAAKLTESQGLIINTFECLEAKAVGAITAGQLCRPEAHTPPVYCIGPLVAAAADGRKSADDNAGDGDSYCLTWLDLQPPCSVVFLCFGSLGRFSVEQIKEIAAGLELSSRRFLWVVRNPFPKDMEVGFTSSSSDLDLETTMPEGFLDRTKERGLLVKNWAPQAAVLKHTAVGAFVTHCGWNSILESVVAGVPMVAWPLYAEQKLNRHALVNEMKVAVAVRSGEDGVVSAEEVAKRVTELMTESEIGQCIRTRVTELMVEAEKAMNHGESSRVELEKLVCSWTSNLV